MTSTHQVHFVHTRWNMYNSPFKNPRAQNNCGTVHIYNSKLQYLIPVLENRSHNWCTMNGWVWIHWPDHQLQLTLHPTCHIRSSANLEKFSGMKIPPHSYLLYLTTSHMQIYYEMLISDIGPWSLLEMLILYYFFHSTPVLNFLAHLIHACNTSCKLIFK